MSSVRVRYLDRDAVLASLRELATRLGAERPEIQEIRLFGSLARGQRNPFADADLLIVLDASDLPIRDGNISRKHAAVIRRNGTFYIKDLGSTNGIDYKGMRIDNKRIDEGDIFNLCDYELRFTYRS